MSQHKVLFLLNQLAIGGTERNVVALSKYLNPEQFEIDLWTLLPGGEFEGAVVSSPVKIRCLHRKKARDPWFALKTAWQISRTDADLVHSFLPTVGFYAALARRLFFFRKPIVQWVGASDFNSLRRNLYWRWLCGSMDLLIANSESVQRELLKLGIPPEKIVIIHNGHDLSAYDQPVDTAAIRQEFQIQPGQKMLLCVSRLVDYKRVRDAIDAFPLILEKGHDAKLIIAGDGVERENLQRQIESLGLVGRVVLTGSRTDVLALRRSADLFFYPSEIEGLSNSVIEASLAGMPIVACSVLGVFDVVKHNEEALLVEARNPPKLAEAADTLLRDPERAKRLAAAAQKQAIRRFGMPSFIGQISDVYHRFLRKK